ncbi:hypothetical protein PGT21_002268 [Puccinia graminis f. sp. tritici]|uniref:Uncharacterized protein n=1 Tax=Puccinia graminis f. sp. tritici TaxID=56615 RepID=A0A5B0S9C6_PUCGR|nr:hypothetical protein PGT21_002268 [Puccinia graminis f. sp. tritici]KAA1133703.1 hypothetical protein PGTUg99_031792 [Puccinia graminis f. sp. tritici]
MTLIRNFGSGASAGPGDVQMVRVSSCNSSVSSMSEFYSIPLTTPMFNRFRYPVDEPDSLFSSSLGLRVASARG